MHIMLIGSAILIPSLLVIACLLLTLRAERYADAANECAMSMQRTVGKLNSERARVTVCERELEALRRELRKLSGKFYAELRAREDEADKDFAAIAELAEEGLETQRWYFDAPHIARMEDRFPVCENWALAKQQGPTSAAAKCACAYCDAQRAERARLRGELVPRTVQGQAELARLNAGKP